MSCFTVKPFFHRSLVAEFGLWETPSQLRGGSTFNARIAEGRATRRNATCFSDDESVPGCGSQETEIAQPGTESKSFAAEARRSSCGQPQAAREPPGALARHRLCGHQPLACSRRNLATDKKSDPRSRAQVQLPPKLFCALASHAAQLDHRRPGARGERRLCHHRPKRD